MAIDLSREPAVWIEVVRAALTLAILYGVKMTEDQLAQTLVLLGLVAVALTRSQVTPKSPDSGEAVVKYINRADPADISTADARAVGKAIDIKAATKGTISVLVLLCLSAVPAFGVTGNVLDPSRGAVGVNVGAVYHEAADAALPTELSLRVAPYLSWALSDQLAAVGIFDFDPNNGRKRARAGLTCSVYGGEGEGTNDHRLQGGLAFYRTWHLRDGDDARFPARESYMAGVNLSWLALATAKRDVLYLKVQFGYDHKNGREAFGGLGLQY